MPAISGFVPAEASSQNAPVVMTVDEYESVRLIDLLDCTQEDCARQMKVARTTVQAVYDSARKKLALALVEGRPLVIQGGDYILCEHAGQCCGKNCRKRRCGRCCDGDRTDCCFLEGED